MLNIELHRNRNFLVVFTRRFPQYFYQIKQMKAFYLLLIVLLNLYVVNSQTYMDFATYVDKFKKKYDDAEYLKRKQIYDARIQSFSKITEFTPGVNEFTDMTDEELAAYRTLQQLPLQARENSQGNRVQASKVGAPTSLDWRDRNVVTSIKNQGSCGCCWAFASVAYVESRLIIQGQYTADNIDLSEMFMLKCTKMSDCDGGYLEYALQSVKNVPSEQRYPYDPYSGNSVDCKENGIRTGYENFNYYSLSDSQLQNLLLSGPVPISISSEGWQIYGSGVFQCAPFSKVDHAVLLVGYTPDYWIIKNQWGKTWGEDGYIRVTKNSARNCQIGTSAHTLSGFFSVKLVGMLISLLVLLMI